MDVGRVQKFDWLTGAAGVVLFIALQMPWYESNSLTLSAWESLTFSDVLLFITSLIAISVPIAAALKDTPGLAQKRTWIALAFGVVGLLVAIWRIASPPQFDEVAAPVARLGGAWLSLAALIAIVVFAWLAGAGRLSARARPSSAAASQS